MTTFPIWFRNLLSLLPGSTPQEWLGVLLWADSAVNRWLDANLVKGDTQNELIVFWTYRLWGWPCRWDKLNSQDLSLAKTYRRLRGLTPLR